MQRTHRLATTLAAGLSALAALTGSAAAAGLPSARIQSILQAKGSVSDGVLGVSIDRDDLGGVHVGATPIKPAFQLDGELDFQSLGHGRALFNGDIPVTAAEIDPVIDAIESHGLVLQAEHQHMYDFAPMVWFIHLRGKGDALRLARAVHSVLKATATPLPQEPPAHPRTPLDKSKLQDILHGYDAEVGSDGVVTVFVRPPHRETLDGVAAKPETNINTNIAFEPLSADGSSAAVVPDFALTASQIDPVMRAMRTGRWDIGCLYNQETGESPQLFFSHQLKTGNPYTLAREIRAALARVGYR